MPGNPRRIADDALARLADSIRRDPEFMALRPIVVDADGTVIGGNQRLRACAEILGMTDLPEGWVVRAEGLTAEQLRRFTIVDNVQAGEWDMGALAEGYADIDLGALGIVMAEPEPDGDADAEPQVDRAEELNREWGVKPGDLWLIGGHRLLCGDSTKAKDVGRLMGDRKPVLMVTDPPYGVEYDPSWRKQHVSEGSRWNSKNTTIATGKVEADDRADWREAWALFPGDVAYVWHGGLHACVVAESLAASRFVLRAQIVWAKQAFVFGRGDYHWQHEPCWYAVRKGASGGYSGDRKQSTVWEIRNNAAIGDVTQNETATGHGTQKPLECMARPMRNHDAPEVYDPFLGSGTTLVAGQNLGRKVYGSEIAPGYCAVILQRMHDAFPGIDIRREEPQ